MQQYQTTTNTNDPFSGRAGLVLPQLAAVPPPLQPPQQWKLPPTYDDGTHQESILFPSSTSYGGVFTKRPSSSIQFGYEYDHHGPPLDHPRLVSDAFGPSFGLHHELNQMTAAQEIIDAKALAASKSHNESERRRRERSNNHLAKLRSLLPNTTKTDKAALLAEVIQHVKDLRMQTSIITETCPVPTETDELTVDPIMDGQDRKLIIKASICCDDRSDLLPELIKTLKSLRLRTLKAEITTLGGRVKNVLLVSQEPPCSNDNDDRDRDRDHDDQSWSVGFIHEALNDVMEKFNGGDESTSSGNAKRQRVTSDDNVD